MGAPTLKKKKELNYRRGQTSRHCSGCDFFVKSFSAIDHHSVCRKIGLKPGRAFRINPNNQCDAFDNTNGLKRLKGE